jgi:hypothetical protein
MATPLLLKGRMRITRCSTGPWDCQLARVSWQASQNAAVVMSQQQQQQQQW